MNQAETKSFLQEVIDTVAGENPLAELDHAVFPSFTSLAAAQSVIESSGAQVCLGAQDIAQYAKGAYTGEVSAEMLKEAGVQGVLVGHSERREIFNEDDVTINAKVKIALEAELKVMLCCGESEATREAGNTDQWVADQIKSALEGLSNEEIDNNIAIAYEPIWAIGTGKTCDSAEANRVIAHIRQVLAEITSEEIANSTRILYGGSVKSANIEELLKTSDIDGALIGGASIKVEEITQILSKAAKLAVTC